MRIWTSNHCNGASSTAPSDTPNPSLNPIDLDWFRSTWMRAVNIIRHPTWRYTCVNPFASHYTHTGMQQQISKIDSMPQHGSEFSPRIELVCQRASWWTWCARLGLVPSRVSPNAPNDRGLRQWIEMHVSYKVQVLNLPIRRRRTYINWNTKERLMGSFASLKWRHRMTNDSPALSASSYPL